MTKAARMTSQTYFLISLFVIFDKTIAVPDLQLSSASFDFSSSNIFQDVLTSVQFSVHLTNNGPPGEGISSTNGSVNNYDVSLLLSDVDLSSAGTSDTLSLPPVWVTYSYSGDDVKLKEGLAADSADTLELAGEAGLVVPSGSCADVDYICVYVTATTGADYTETESENNYDCRYIKNDLSCTADTLNLSILQFELQNSIIYSNGYGHLSLALQVDIGGSYQLIPTAGNAQAYKVRLFISTDDVIDDSFDLQVATVPSTFTNLEKTFKASGSVYLGGPDLRAPDVHTDPINHIYCGQVYLGVVVDHGPGHGKLLETNEWDNSRVIPVFLSCPIDMWAISNPSISLGLMQDTIYPSTEFDVSVGVTVRNLHNVSYPGGTAAFLLKLFLSDSSELGQGNELELTQIGNVNYSRSPFSSLSAVCKGCSLRLDNAIVHVPDNVLTSNDGYTHIILHVSPIDVYGIDGIKRNNYFSQAINVADAAITDDLSVADFAITEDTIEVDGATTPTVTLEGTVALGSVDPASFTTKVFWSKDNQYDPYDQDSGMAVNVAGDGGLSLTGAPLATPADASFCGRLYAILVLDSEEDVEESYEFNNFASDVVLIKCNTDDALALNYFHLREPSPAWVKGSDVTFEFMVQVSCTAADCSGKTAGTDNFDFKVFLDTNKVRVGDEPELTVTGGFIATDGGQGIQSDLTATPADVTLKAKVTIDAASCNADNRYLRLELDPLDDFLDNNYLYEEIKLDCSETGAVDIAATDLSGITSITAGSPTDFDAEVEITTDGYIQLPHLEWARTSVKLVASTDDVIDDDDLEIPYFLTQCQVSALAEEVSTGSTNIIDLGLPDTGFVIPSMGFERLCGSDVYLALVYDPDNLIHEVDETNNVAIVGSAVPFGSVNGLICPPASSQTLDATWMESTVDKLSSPIYVQSLYVMDVQVKVTNMFTEALTREGASGDDFGLEAYLSENGTPGEVSDILLDVVIDTDDMPKLSSGLQAGSSVLINVRVSVAADALVPEACNTLQAGTPQLLIVTSDVRVDSGFTAGPAGSLGINLICQLKMEPTSMSLSSVPTLWPQFSYDVGFTADIVHKGKYSSFFSETDDNFIVKLKLSDGSSTDVDLVNMTISNPSIQRQIINNEESVIVYGTASVILTSAECTALDTARSIIFTVEPQGVLPPLGYTPSSLDQAANAPPADISLECSDSYVQLQAVGLRLLDDANEEIDSVNLDEDTKFEIDTVVKVGTDGSITPFTSGSGKNYDYKFYLSRDGLNFEQELTHTSSGGDLEAAVAAESEATHTLTGTDLHISTAEGEKSCGSVYLMVALYDLRNPASPSGSPTNILTLLEASHTRDPVTSDNFFIKRISVKCPSDLFALTDLSVSTNKVLNSGQASLQFSVKVTNAHWQGYDIPTPENGAPFFTFKMEQDDGAEIPIDDIRYSSIDAAKITSGLTAGDSVELSDVLITFPIDATICGKISSDDWYIAVAIGGGMSVGMIDHFNSNERIQITNVDCIEPKDLEVTDMSHMSTSDSGTDKNITIDLVLMYSEESDTNALSDPSLQFYGSTDKDLDTEIDFIASQYMQSSVKAVAGLGISWTAAITVTLEEAEWKAMCGIGRLFVVIDSDDTIYESNEGNNIGMMDIPIDCGGDLYHADFEMNSPTTLSPGMPLTISFETEVFNVGSNDILAGSAGLNYNFKLLAQKGSILNLAEAADMTPRWNFYRDEESFLTDSLTKYSSAGDKFHFTQVDGKLIVPEYVCGLEYDHLFIALVTENARASPTEPPIDECVTANNYRSFPITCNYEGGIDLVAKSLASSQETFRTLTIGGAPVLFIGLNSPFALDLDVDIAGNNGWMKRTVDDGPPFTLSFTITRLMDGETRGIEYVTPPEMFHTDVDQTTTIHLGGYLYMNNHQFIDMCDTMPVPIRVEVTIDADDDIAEINENNNQATFDATLTPCPVYTDIIATGVYIEPGDYNEIILASQDVDYRFEFEIRGTSVASFKYKAALSLDRDWENPSNALLFEDEQSHTVSDGNIISMTSKISVYISEDPAFEFNQIFCGKSPYLGLWLDYDAAAGETGSTSNNIIWKPVKFLCDEIQGLALSEFRPYGTDLGTVLRTGGADPTLYFDLTILNVGEDIPAPSPAENDIFDLNLYLNTQPDLDGALLLSPVTYTNSGPRNIAMKKQTAVHFKGVEVNFPLPLTSCIDKTHLCIEVVKEDGMLPGWIDDHDGDNYNCFQLYDSAVGLVCDRDVALADLDISLVSNAKLIKDTEVMVAFDLNLATSGYAFQAYRDPPIGLNVYVSDQASVTPSGVFNGGSPVLLTEQDMVTFTSDSRNELTGVLLPDPDRTIYGNFPVTIPGALCSSITHICIKYTDGTDAHPPIQDTDSSNDESCYDVQALLTCGDDVVDFVPLGLEVLNSLMVVGEYNSFNLLVEADVGPGVEPPLPVFADLFLSTDSTYDINDYQIPYDGFYYGRAMDEKTKTLSVGINRLNLGGDFLRIVPGFDETLYCGHVYLIAKIRSQDTLVETNRNNNDISTVIDVVCSGDLFILTDLDIHFPQPLFAEESSEFSFDVTVTYVGPGDLPRQSLMSPHYTLQAVAVSATEDVIATDMIYPDLYFMPMPSMKRIRLIGVKGRIDPDAFTQTVCYLSTDFKIILVPVSADIIENHDVEVPWSPALRYSSQSDLTQITVDHYSVPGEIVSPGYISMELAMTIEASSLYPKDFVFRLYVSRSQSLDENLSKMLKEYTIADEISSKTSFNLGDDIEFDELDYPDFCGTVYFVLLVDADNDVIEPSKADHVLSRPSFIQCSEDFYGISDLEFYTFDHQIIAGSVTKFDMKLNLTCSKAGCDVTPDVENFKFLLTSKRSTSDRFTDLLADIDAAWIINPENLLYPGLGEGFFFRGQSKEIHISGSLTITPARCSSEGTNILSVQVNFGSSLSSVTDNVQDNNFIKWPYKCVKEILSDIKVRDFHMLSGEVILTGMNKFGFSVEVDGEPVSALAAGPTVAPFKLALYLSHDDKLSADDEDLHYVMSAYTSRILSGGLNLGTTYDILELDGVDIPSTRCGEAYILLHVDSANEIIETVEENNIVSRHVQIKCTQDMLKAEDVSLTNAPRQIWQDYNYRFMADLVLQNSGFTSIPPCPDCRSINVISALSKDDIWQPALDVNVTIEISQEVLEKLSLGLQPSEQLAIRNLNLELSLPADKCGDIEYLLLGAVVTAPMVDETYIINNFKIIPFDIVCEAVTQIFIDDVTFDGSLADGGSQDYHIGLNIVAPSSVTFHYRFWLSLDGNLDDDDYMIVTSVPLSPISGSGVVTVDETLAVPANIDHTFCGNVFILTEMDYLDEVDEVDNMNNTVSTAVLVECTNDVFEVSSASLSFPIEVIEPNVPVDLIINVTVTCLAGASCPVAASHPSLAFPIHFYTQLKTYTADLLETGSVSPSDIDAVWISATEGDGDPATYLSPVNAMNADFTSAADNAMTFSISGTFIFEAPNDCSKIRYLGVGILQGDSQQVEGSSWTVLDNNRHLLPLKIRCVQGVDLSIASLTLDGVDSGLTINISKTPTLDLSFAISSPLWPTEPHGRQKFGINFFASATMAGSDRYRVGYILPDEQQQSLVSMPLNGDDISISDSNMILDRGTLLRFCGHTGYIGVLLDVYNQQEEISEENNEGFVEFTLEGCPSAASIDLAIRKVFVPSFAVSGDTVVMDITVDAVTVEDVTLPAPLIPDQATVSVMFENTDIELEVSPVGVDPNAALTGAPGEARSQTYILNYNLKIPKEMMFCKQSWSLSVAIALGGTEDLISSNNAISRPITIGCPDDVFALKEFNLLSLPEDLWPTLPVSVDIDVTVANIAISDVPGDPTGLVKVKVAFSVDNVFDIGDNINTFQLVGSDFLFTDEFTSGQDRASPRLTAEFLIADVNTCNNAIAVDAAPTLFVVIEAVDPALSTYTDNDILSYPLEKDRFQCGSDQVDLFIKSFHLEMDDAPTDELIPNNFADFQLKIGIYKTSTGTIPAAASGDLDDYSMMFNFYLSTDSMLSDGDVKIPLILSSDQKFVMRRGITTIQPSPYEITIDGHNLKVDLEANPDWKYYCGSVNLMVEVKDLKNEPKIDPNPRNDVLTLPITLYCDGDQISVTEFNLLPLPPQSIVYSGVDVDMDLTLTFWNNGEDIPLPHDGRNNFFLKAYMSDDTRLDLDLDAEIPIIKISPEMERQLKLPLNNGGSITFDGVITLHFPLSSCTLNYLIFEVHKGIHITTREFTYLNNLRYMEASDLVKCSIDYIDFAVDTFTLTAGNAVQPGSSYNFSLTTEITTGGIATVDKVSYQLFLSKDERFDEDDVSFDPAGVNPLMEIDTSGVFDTTSILPAGDSGTVEAVVPETGAPHLCGNVYILAVIDEMNLVEEKSEYNNAFPLPVKVECLYDLYQIKDVEVKQSTTYTVIPAPIELSLKVDNLHGQDLVSDNVNELFHIKVYVASELGSVKHDITPDSWNYEDGQEGQAVDTFSSGATVTYTKLSGNVNLLMACDAPMEPLPLDNARVPFYVEVVRGKHPSLANIQETIVDNNIYVTDIEVDCLDGSNDFRAGDLTLPPATVLGFEVIDYDFTAYASYEPGVDLYYGIAFAAGPFRTYVYNGDDIANVDCTGPCEISGSGSVEVTSDDFLFLCSYDGEVDMIISLDPYNDIYEANEENNDIILSSLNFDVTQCADSLDLEALEFSIEAQDLDVVRAEEPTNFQFTVGVTLTGLTNWPPLTGADTHFDWSFVLSNDSFYDPGVDALFPPTELSAGQLSALQASLSASSGVLDLTGSNLVIPLTKETAQYCWTHPYLGVLIDPLEVLDESGIYNNERFYQIILDCGDNLDECAEDLDSCNPFATCEDQVYNLKTFEGEPYMCYCPDGFIDTGTTCLNIDECAEDETLCADVEFSTCRDLNGTYECACVPGYVAEFDGEIQTCINVNECEDPGMNNCHDLADCVDSVGSYRCICQDGYEGDGILNCTDIIDCTNTSCGGVGLCIEEIGGFSCICDDPYHGPTCQSVDGSWGQWSEWSDCMAHCGLGYIMRNRMCSDPIPTPDGKICSMDQNATYVEHVYGCEQRLCDEGHIPWCDYDPCFEDSGGICTYEEKGRKYRCDCKPGYTIVNDAFDDKYFMRCRDINECTENDIFGNRMYDCHADATCINEVPGFVCVCKKGFVGDGRNCTDVDECSGVGACAENMDCENTVGSFSCSCMEGFKEADDNKRCIESRLFPYGADAGDTEIIEETSLTDERASPIKLFPEGLPIYDGQLANSFYISENGLIVLTNATASDSRREAFPYPTSLPFALDNNDIVGLLAPFWTDNKNEMRFHKIWYQEYDDRSKNIVQKMEALILSTFSTEFEAKYLLKVTWDNMAPVYPSQTKERNTYQAVLVTDNLSSYIFYIYDDEGMNWEPTSYNTTKLQIIWRGYPAKIGYAIRDKLSDDHIYEDENSGKWTQFRNNPNAYRISEKVVQEHGKEGWLIYKLDSNNLTDYNNPRQQCSDWYQGSADPVVWGHHVIGHCPRSVVLAQLDPRFVKNNDDSDNCYRRAVSNIYGAGTKCCYLDGGLIENEHAGTNYQDKGFITETSPFSNEEEHNSMDKLPYQLCCQDSELVDYCQKYIEKRPVTTSKNYSPMKQAYASGSVQISTFDGSVYPLRGYGEYILLRTKDGEPNPLMMQLRTDDSPIQATGDSKAVIVSGVAGAFGDGPSLEAHVNGDVVDVYVDGVPYTGQSLPNGVGIVMESNSAHLIFDHGFTLSAVAESGRLLIKVKMEGSLGEGQYEGLLGDFDGNAENDFVLESGEDLNPVTATEDYHTFVESWSMRNAYGSLNADSNTLFSHYTDPDSANNYFKAGFTPNFYSIGDYTTDQVTLCTPQGEPDPDMACLYVVKETGNIPWASSTMSSTAALQEESDQLGNSPPKFDVTLKETLKVYGGVTHTVAIKAQDKDGPVTFQVKVTRDGETTTEEVSSAVTAVPNVYKGTYYLLLDNTSPVIFRVIATDSKGAVSLYMPNVVICDCKNNGQCDFDHVKTWEENFGVARCLCQLGYSGELCQDDFLGCQVRHCYGECTDLNAATVSGTFGSKEFRCESCPTGMIGNGETCSDLNECILPSSDLRKHKCSHRCINVEGSYRCECKDGYIMSEDGFTCQDIKECNNAILNDCDPNHGICTESPEGSYTCSCDMGFNMGAENRCFDIDECVVNNGGCSRHCVNTYGGFYCDCGYGYAGEHFNSSTCSPKELCDELPLCDDECDNRNGYYDCQCRAPFFQLELDDHSCSGVEQCVAKACDASNGYCAVINSEELCFCHSGYQLSTVDHNTCLDQNECLIGTALCGVDSDCVNTPGSYECTCREGYRPVSYTHDCQNIDECTETDHGCEHSCVDTMGTFKCECKPGYFLQSDGKTCIDKDECGAGVINDCSPHATCHNFDGSYLCKCKEGFSGNGLFCTPFDMCFLDNYGCAGDCYTQDGSAFCACADGYFLDMADRKSCHDVDECALPDNVCPQNCTNTIGSFTCECHSGFVKDSKGECVADPMYACNRDCGQGTCLLVAETEECICDQGYAVNILTTTCLDVNECVTGHQCTGPRSSCVNKDGYYECSCGQGYRLKADKLTCEDENECLSPDPDVRHKCDLLSTTCENTEGGYDCMCLPGYTEVYNEEFYCEDINECVADDFSNPCHETHGLCENIPGGFQCQCINGFEGDGITCIDVNECLDSEMNTCTENQACINTNGSYTCTCRDGFKLDANGLCIDINECSSPILSGCNFDCLNTPGSYKCLCPVGYQLDPLNGKICEVETNCNDPDIIASCWQECARINNVDTCKCRRGYSTRGNKCFDIDECTIADPELTNKCGVHSACNNTQGAYECLCDRYYLKDADGMACSETDGNWGTWSIWTTCSRTCHGRRMRRRSCDSPPPTHGRMCPGSDLEYAMCDYMKAGCRTRREEVQNGVFFDMDKLKVQWWETAESAFFSSISKFMNAFCTKDNVNYRKCCGRDPETNDAALFRQRFASPTGSDVSLAWGYPREHASGGTRVMVIMGVKKNNPLCGIFPDESVQNRKRRATSEVYYVPDDLIIDAMNNSVASNAVSNMVSQDPLSGELPYAATYKVEKAYDEDFVPEAIPTSPPKDYTAVIMYTLAVFFALILLLVLGLAILYLVRNPQRVNTSEEDLIKAARDHTPIDQFRSEIDLERGDDEESILNELMINNSDTQSDVRPESEMDLPNTPMPTDSQALEGEVKSEEDQPDETPRPETNQKKESVAQSPQDKGEEESHDQNSRVSNRNVSRASKRKESRASSIRDFQKVEAPSDRKPESSPLIKPENKQDDSASVVQDLEERHPSPNNTKM